MIRILIPKRFNHADSLCFESIFDPRLGSKLKHSCRLEGCEHNCLVAFANYAPKNTILHKWSCKIRWSGSSLFL